MPFIEQILAGLVIAAIVALAGVLFSWIRKRRFHVKVRVENIPVTIRAERRDLGFIGPVLQISVTNKSDKDITIEGLRIMFSRCFGAPVLSDAPSGYSHQHLPAVLSSGTEQSWYVSVEDLSALLETLHCPVRPSDVPNTREIKLRVKCTTITETVYKSSAFLFPQEPSSNLFL